MNPKPDMLEDAIISTLETTIAQLHLNEVKGNSNWTKAIKEALAQLAANRSCIVCTSGFEEEYEPEWLYDMVWYIENKDKKLVSVPLVVESEWNISQGAIKYDFEKLLLANSTHKLMICQCYTENKDKLKEYFKEAIQSYELNKTGDRYLVAILDFANEEFEFLVYVKS